MKKETKTKEQLLERFKRANKDYKLTILAKEGYSNAEDYIKFLSKKTNKTKVSKSKVTIHNVFIMDDSGSMSGGKYNNGVKGIQELVKSIQSDNLTNNTISIVDLNRGVVNWMQDPKTVSYEGHRNLMGTPLYITIGKTVNDLLGQIKSTDKVLLNITTDGQDTDGFQQYNNLPQILKKVQKENNFTVTFVGTQGDVDFIISKLNVDKSNTLVHDNTAEGMKMSFQTTNIARQNYSTRTSVGLDTLKGFYKEKTTL